MLVWKREEGYEARSGAGEEMNLAFVRKGDEFGFKAQKSKSVWFSGAEEKIKLVFRAHGGDEVGFDAPGRR